MSDLGDAFDDARRKHLAHFGRDVDKVAQQVYSQGILTQAPVLETTDMLIREDASMVDDLLMDLPDLLAGRGLILKQKRGYKAGKLSASRNWCRIVDGDMYPGVPGRDSRGEFKTWRLFARFDAGQPPSWPWDNLEQCEGKKPQGMMSGDDVWGVSYEGLQTWSRAATGRQIAERLAGDLQISFNYSRQRYC